MSEPPVPISRFWTPNTPLGVPLKKTPFVIVTLSLPLGTMAPQATASFFVSVNQLPVLMLTIVAA